MMKKSFTLLLVSTCLTLLYVHSHVMVFHVSYSIGKKEKKLSELSDIYKETKYRVSRLRSLNYLDKQRQETKIGLVEPDQVKVIRVPVGRQEERRLDQLPPLKRSLMSFGSMIKEAQAKMSRD